jgi:RNA polymerase sigma-70 factor (ECF subfamily)
MNSSQPESSTARRQAEFATTHWSLVAAAAQGHSSDAKSALSELCQRYWYPLYAFLRRSGSDREQAEDLTQGFFLDLIEHQRIAVADPERGRFRTFLLASLKNFRSNRQRADQAIKRGGQAALVSIDFAAGEHRYRNEPYHELTPERLYERKWALQLLQQTLTALESEADQRGKSELFSQVRPLLAGGQLESSYTEIAERVGMTVGAVKVAVHRWREQFGREIRAEIRRTVASDEDVDSEIETLFQAMRE